MQQTTFCQVVPKFHSLLAYNGFIYYYGVELVYSRPIAECSHQVDFPSGCSTDDIHIKQPVAVLRDITYWQLAS